MSINRRTVVVGRDMCRLRRAVESSPSNSTHNPEEPVASAVLVLWAVSAASGVSAVEAFSAT